VNRLLTVLGTVLFALLVLGMLAVHMVRRTIPPVEGAPVVEGLEAPGTIAYDAAGVPVIRAASERDVAFLQGWAHARDRRFQMELQRRSAAGRLAETVGAAALGSDRRFRTFGFASVADSALHAMNPRRRELFEAYAAGVNAYDRDHPAPLEYAMMGIAREPWSARDCILMLLLMYEQLNDDASLERDVELMDDTLPPELVAFLTPATTPIDVALEGSPAPAPPPIPGPDVVDLRAAREAVARVEGGTLPRSAEATHRAGSAAAGAAGRGPSAAVASAAARDRAFDAALAREAADRGSNNWVIGPSRTATGGAIFAGDPHLGLRVPVIWHRQRLEGGGLAVTGITLPGAPGVIMGSNGDVAWSFTNVEPDAADLVRVEVADAETTSYLGPRGPEPFRVRREAIRVKGGRTETLVVRETRWGPIVGPSVRGGLLALQWVALDPWMCDEDLYGINRARSLDEFLARLADFRGPAQNAVAADRAGRIGWGIAGWLPRRIGHDPSRPRDGADSTARWDGYASPAELPRLVDPPSGVIATANQRTVGGAWLERVFGAGYGMPWRARRIHDMLASRDRWTAEDAAALQNDVDDAFLGPTAAALDRALTPAAIAADDTLARIRRLLDRWTHRADTTSVAHAYLRHARVALNVAVQTPLVAPCVARDSAFAYDWPLSDEVTRRLLEERPQHLLDPAFDDWDALVRAAAKDGARRLSVRAGGTAFDSVTWGAINRAAIRHPIGDAVAQLGAWLNMPAAALAGGSFTVRVANPRSGASMRMVVDLADPVRSRFALPGGQSGHFLSPHYADGYADWVAGRTGPFEPGAVRGTFRFTPGPRR
jgi:penicillin amidase